MQARKGARKPDAQLNRRDFIRRAALLGAASGLALSGCTTAYGASNATEDVTTEPTVDASAPGDAGALDCSDTSGLNAAEISTREQLKYVEQTPKPAQDCANCLHWKPVSGEGCGGCAIMAGKFNPRGWCIAWVATRS
ncbi:high-potential iron-sulfur protein [Bradymonas sediminis]|nr:high-potential iron-sulfur protein [Bradymonas sediminis]TDP77263.1 secreted protein [Bradymonas sediminis]